MAVAFANRNLTKKWDNRIKANDITHYTPLAKVCADLVFGYMAEATFAWDCVWKVLEFIDVWDKYDAVLLHEANKIIEDLSAKVHDIDMQRKGSKRKEPEH